MQNWWRCIALYVTLVVCFGSLLSSRPLNLMPACHDTHPQISPTVNEGVAWVRRGLEQSGIYQLRALRDHLKFQFGRDPIHMNFYFDPNNAGPMYFLVVLTLGIVVPGGFAGTETRRIRLPVTMYHVCSEGK